MDLTDPGTEPRSPALQENSLTSEPPGKPHSYLERATNIVFFLFILMVEVRMHIGDKKETESFGILGVPIKLSQLSKDAEKEKFWYPYMLDGSTHF